MLSVKKVDTRNEFLKLRGDWTTLLKKSKSDTVFLAWEWMYTLIVIIERQILKDI